MNASMFLPIEYFEEFVIGWQYWGLTDLLIIGVQIIDIFVLQY